MADMSIRFGGREVDGVYRFELNGGPLALDFVNTLDERRAEPKELLADYARLIQWSAQSGALSEKACSRLLQRAGREPRKAAQALRTARTLRELIFSILTSLDRNEDLDATLMADLNRWIVKVGSHKSLLSRDGEFQWVYDEKAGDFQAMLWPVVDSAAFVLADRETATRIKLCEGETCAWAFIDNSRRRNRRWCDMTVCGNRAKAKRHRRRVSGATS